jgi:hypothetical protein
MRAASVCVYCVSRARIRSPANRACRDSRVNCTRVAAVLISANERPLADEIVASNASAGYRRD